MVTSFSYFYALLGQAVHFDAAIQPFVTRSRLTKQ